MDFGTSAWKEVGGGSEFYGCGGIMVLAERLDIVQGRYIYCGIKIKR